MAGYIDDKDDLLARLARIEGQVRGLARMVERDTYCIDVLTQVSSTTRALAVGGAGVARGPSDPLRDRSRRPRRRATRSDKLREASAAIARLVKS